MKTRKRLLTIALTAALGLGVWTAAFSFTPAGFNDGDILSAAELNNLLNGNFNSVETEFTTMDSAKLNKTGGTITGRTNISGAATSTGTGDVNTVFRANNTGTSGSAGVFQSDNDSDSGAVSIKQQGIGPALTLKSNGGGPLITGAGALKVTFIVEDTGSIKIGDMGVDGTDDPTLHLNAQTGTITNNVGSGLPLAFGYVAASGAEQSGTSNFTSTRLADNTYEITFTGETYSRDGFATIAQGNSPGKWTTHATEGGGKLLVSVYDQAGNKTFGAFHFVTYKDGH